ncbi:FMN-dependent NADH-azoreductase [Clostridium cavendishii DSM 21758]|uniref:FMN dependent NADH:quinone oxidoreductase n=1 Tax=Clostridium cavendishii DSM 21758 TaxID=1121302 RepID=A0A1M6CFC5_9CLOT|nr:NAD(P)H-dependent oxidoreductase [Clostridium cavendishii]SHI59735.1 FMN-dependent NADH-azoreductase [Clostridium cavendishii DSM 21758]
MKKLLYITVNSKPENLSSSKTVGREFVNRFITKYPEFQLEELDLYKDHIPRLKYQYFENRNDAINKDNTQGLSAEEKKEVDRIMCLCNQFIETDVCVIAAPMWSLSFPAPLKEYIDCIVQVDKTVSFAGGKPKGLLDDKKRAVVYVQSSGGNIPWMFGPMANKGLNYIEDIMNFMGIKNFQKLLVDGTGYTEKDMIAAIEKAKKEIDDIIDKIEV